MGNAVENSKKPSNPCLILTLFCLSFLGGGVLPVRAQVNAPSESAWITDGPVYAIAQAPGKIYLGGLFTSVAPNTGCGAALDCGAGRASGKTPRVDDAVESCVADGAGGWFIGGRFKTVGGLPRVRLAHILSDGSVDPAWAPSVDNTSSTAFVHVNALALSGATLYLGGDFTSVNGQPRQILAAVDAATGLLKDWNPNAGDAQPYYQGVTALAVSGSTLYVGGGFTSIGGQPRKFLAALDAATGQVLPWDPNANSDEDSNYAVACLAVSGSRVYVGGFFTKIGSQTRRGMAAVDAATGALTDWNPNVTGSSGFPGVLALAVSGSRVYAGGDFNFIGGKARNGLAALDASTNGTATDWDPKVSLTVRALAVSGSTLYAGGYGVKDNGSGSSVTGSIAFAADVATGALTAWAPNPSGFSQNLTSVNDDVYALAVSGSRVYLGGSFKSVGGLKRSGLAALDPATGAPTSWNHGATLNSLPNAGIRALLCDGARVYAGGNFTEIGGQKRQGLAALDAASGAVLPWNPNPSYGIYIPTIYALALRGSTLYVGGIYSAMGGLTRNNLAALDAASGAVKAWNPGANSTVFALATAGSTVYVGGWFSIVGGQSRSRLAAVDALSTGTVTAWNPCVEAGSVNCLAVGGGMVYVGGDFFYVGYQSRKWLAALDAVTGAAADWAIKPSYPVSALSLAGLRLYGGGGYSISHHSSPIPYLFALDRATGAATAWSPQQPGFGPISALALDGSGVYVGYSGYPGFAHFKFPSAVGRSNWMSLE